MGELVVLDKADLKSIFLYFGICCLKPKLATDERYVLDKDCFTEPFHRVVHGCIFNLSKRGLQSITPIDIDNECSPFAGAKEIWEVNNGFEYVQSAIDMCADKIGNIGKYYDDIKKFATLRIAMKDLGLDIKFIYDHTDSEKMYQFSEMNNQDILNAINNKFLDFKSRVKHHFGDNESFHARDGIHDRIEYHRLQENAYGYPMMSSYLTEIFKGYRRGKFIVQASLTGAGKSRAAMANAIDMAGTKIYDWINGKWKPTGHARGVLYLSTEMQKFEFDDCVLAHVSGIPQGEIENWFNITPEREEILHESASEIANSKLWFEYISTWTIDTLSELIERHVINNNIEQVFFDYLGENLELYATFSAKSKGAKLRTDQILGMTSEVLKLLANRFNICIATSTQTNDSVKLIENRDASAVRGAKSIIDKCDCAYLSIPVSSADIKRLKPVIEALGHFDRTPTMSHWVFKNRGAKWNKVIVWTRLDLDTVREVDMFVTDKSYNLITDIERVVIDFEGVTDMSDT